MFGARPTTVDGAIKGLLTAVSNLDFVIEAATARVGANRSEISRLEGRVLADEAEVKRASAIAGKLRAITEE
jgi:hypothetical protein